MPTGVGVGGFYKRLGKVVPPNIDGRFSFPDRAVSVLRNPGNRYLVHVGHRVHGQCPEFIRESRRVQHRTHTLSQRPPHALDLRQLLRGVH
eukprot:2530222-Pyramimonas_sp.AAC.1